MKNKFFVFILLSFLSFSLFSQELQNGYGGVALGMSISETKEALLKNTDFGYRGDRDVSLSPGQNQTIIETDATHFGDLSYLTQCWFQFYNDKLYAITININTNKIDYYTLFSTLSKKYGNPDSLNPTKATWKNESITMSLEKPLSVKYIDNSISNEISKHANIQKAGEELTKELFLEGF